MNKFIIFITSKTEKEIKSLRSHFENMQNEIENFDSKDRRKMKRKVKITKFNLSL